MVFALFVESVDRYFINVLMSNTWNLPSGPQNVPIHVTQFLTSERNIF